MYDFPLSFMTPFWRLIGRHREVVTKVNFARRLGLSPQERGSLNNGTCPDIFELTDGNFAVIGTDRTEELERKLPPDAARAGYERIVVITRETMIAAKRDIPER